MSKKLICLFAALPLAFAATLNAQMTFTISDMDSHGPALTELVSTGSTNPLGGAVNGPTLVLDKFDSSLGTLTGVTLTLMAGFDSSGSVVNSSASDVTARVNEDAEFNYESPVLSSNAVIAAADDTGFTTFATGATGTPVTLTDSQMEVFSTGAGTLTMSDFVGSAGDTFPVDYFSVTTLSATGGGGNLDILVDTNATLKATVEYEYVPEPGSFSLLFAAGLGLLGIRRKRA